MPNFDTRKPQEPNEPNRFRMQLVANKLRTLVIAAKTRTHLIANKLRGLLMASKLRILLLSSGVLLFVTVALTVALLIYAPSWLGNQKQVVSGKAQNDDNMLSACARSGGQQASPTRRANGKIAFTQTTTNRGIYVINVHRDIYVIDDEGIHEKRLTHTRQLLEENPVWSPDGQKIAFTTVDSALHVMNDDGTNKTQLAVDLSNSREVPSWSPDGQKIAFATATDTRFPTGISVINADGTRFRRNEVSLISGPFSGNWEDQAMVGSPVWSPDGERIAFYDSGMIYVINIDGSGRTPKPLTEGTSATWSPDGQKIAFLTGAYESDVSTVLNVINADGSGVRRLANTTETGPQFSPAWSPDGEKIAFFCPGGKGIDLCTINADGTGLTRVALKVAPEGSLETASWGSG